MALVIRESAIHARGCYTTEAIKRNALIIEYVGSRISNNEANDLYDDYEQTYLFGLEDGKTIIDGYGVAAFINHSCRPNCRTDEFKGHIWIIADRNIKAGEELTYDYNFRREGGEDESEPRRYACRCGSRRCRGTILSPRGAGFPNCSSPSAQPKQKPYWLTSPSNSSGLSHAVQWRSPCSPLNSVIPSTRWGSCTSKAHCIMGNAFFRNSSSFVAL